jgi:hypothetical protein
MSLCMGLSWDMLHAREWSETLLKSMDGHTHARQEQAQRVNVPLGFAAPTAGNDGVDGVAAAKPQNWSVAYADRIIDFSGCAAAGPCPTAGFEWLQDFFGVFSASIACLSYIPGINPRAVRPRSSSDLRYSKRLLSTLDDEWRKF